MLISGVWLLCDDGVVRPVIYGEVLAGSGSWVKAPFLVDTAADRTVFSADILKALQLPCLVTPEQLSGVGGRAASVVVETQVRLTREGDNKVVFRGQYAALTEPEALDMSVLGRDLTNLFAVITDRPRDFVCLLGQRHQYVIVER
jgi:hypothetical protein